MNSSNHPSRSHPLAAGLAILFLMLLPGAPRLSAQTDLFVETLGGDAKTAESKAIAVGLDDHTYLAGDYSGEIAFGPTVLAAAEEDQSTAYVVARDAAGLPLWAKRLSASGAPEFKTTRDGMPTAVDTRLEIKSIEVSGDFVYVAGAFSGILPLTKDNGTQVELYSSVDDGNGNFLGRAGFVAKLKADSGGLVWAKGLKNLTDGSSIINDVAVNDGFVYVCGDFSGTVNAFGNTITPLGIGNSNERDMFVAKLGPNNGTRKWVNHGGGPKAGVGEFDPVTDNRQVEIQFSPSSFLRYNVVFELWNGDESDSTLEDTAAAIVVDGNGDAYVVGRTLGKKGLTSARLNITAIGTIPISQSDDLTLVTGELGARFSSRIETGPDRVDPVYSGQDNSIGGTTALGIGDDIDDKDVTYNVVGEVFVGTPTWFAAKFEGEGGKNTAMNFEPNNWYDNNTQQDVFSQANDVALVGGFIYVVGKHFGVLRDANPMNTVTGNGSSDPPTATDGWVMKLDVALQIDGLEEGVRGPGDESVERITGRDGKIYVSGFYGGPSARFTRADGSAGPTPIQLPTLGTRNLFTASLSDNLSWSWAKAPSIQEAPPDLVVTSGIGVNASGSLLQLTGSWGGPGEQFSVRKGNVIAKLTAGDPQSSFLYSVDANDGSAVEAVTVTVVSLVSGEYAFAPDKNNTYTIAKGVPFSAVVPARIYERPSDAPEGKSSYINVLSLEEDDGKFAGADYTIRHTCIGYSIGDGVSSDSGPRFEGVINKNTTLEFNWETEFAVEVTSDFSGTKIEGATGLDSGASGNPVPAVGRHWILSGTNFTAFIDGVGAAGEVEHGSHAIEQGVGDVAGL